MRHTLIATALLLLAPLAQAETIPLRQGLTLTSSVSHDGKSANNTTTVTAITPRLVKLSFSGQQADGSALSSSRNVRVQDLQTAKSIRPYFANGKTELFENTTAIGASALVLSELKAGGSTLSLDVGGLSMKGGLTDAGVTHALDGMLEGMGGFAGISEALEAAGASGVIDNKDLADGHETMGEIDRLKLAEGKLTAADLVAHCKGLLAGYKVPREIRFEAIPKTSTGKIQKFELRKQAGSAAAIDV